MNARACGAAPLDHTGDFVHQTMIGSRLHQVNALRSLLREYYPAALAAFGTDLADRDALAVLAAAPTPTRGWRLSQARIEALLRKAGRQRNIGPPPRA